MLLTPISSLPPSERPVAGDWFLLSIAMAFSTVGVLIASHRPSNRIGWIACAAGLLFATQGFSAKYPLYDLFAKADSLPAAGRQAARTRLRRHLAKRKPTQPASTSSESVATTVIVSSG